MYDKLKKIQTIIILNLMLLYEVTPPAKIFLLSFSKTFKTPFTTLSIFFTQILYLYVVSSICIRRVYTVLVHTTMWNWKRAPEV